MNVSHKCHSTSVRSYAVLLAAGEDLDNFLQSKKINVHREVSPAAKLCNCSIVLLTNWPILSLSQQQVQSPHRPCPLQVCQHTTRALRERRCVAKSSSDGAQLDPGPCRHAAAHAEGAADPLLMEHSAVQGPTHRREASRSLLQASHAAGHEHGWRVGGYDR